MHETPTHRASRWLARVVGVVAAVALIGGGVGWYSYERRQVYGTYAWKVRTSRLHPMVVCCRACYSTAEVYQQRVYWVVDLPDLYDADFKSHAYDGCDHRWEEGIPRAHQTPVKDGQVVLAYHKGRYATITLHKQGNHPEAGAFDWRLRHTDGTVARGSDKITRNKHNALTIRFADVEIEWSGSHPGSGYVYYPFPPGPVTGDPVRLCFPGVSDADAVDPADPKWAYKASLSEPGWSPPPPEKTNR